MHTFRSIGTMVVDPRWRMHGHRHECNELLIVMRGRMLVEGTDGVRLGAGNGDVLLYPTGVRHAETNDSESPIEMVFMQMDGHIAEDLCMAHDRDHRIRSIAGWLLHSRSAMHDGAGRLLAALTEAITEEFIRLRCIADIDPVVESIRAFVYKNIAKTINVAQLAEIATQSEYHFIRSYKKTSGFTPMEDVRRIRLEEAKKMICTTGLPLRAIADATGYVNEYHFSASFKKHFGSPPGAFRH